MANCGLDQHCINCELFMDESEIHKSIGINAENYGSSSFNVTVVDAIFCIYGFSARDLAFAHLNSNFETDENILDQNELSEVTSHILQRGLPLCSNCVSSIKQIFINHVKLKKEASKSSLLSKVLQKNRSLPIKTEVDCAEECGSNHENFENSPHVFEPLHEFEDFGFRSSEEDIKVGPLSSVQNEDQFSPNKPSNIGVPPINSGTLPISRSRPRKQCMMKFSTNKEDEKERLLNRQRQETHSPSENNLSNGNTKVNEDSENCNISHTKSQAIQNLFEGEEDESNTAGALNSMSKRDTIVLSAENSPLIDNFLNTAGIHEIASISPNVFHGNLEPERKRSRKPKPETWGKNINKSLRMKGLPYLGIKKSCGITVQKPPRTMGSGCKSSLCNRSKSRHCSSFSLKDREQLFKTFWNFDWNEKKIYVNSLIDKIVPKRKYIVGESSRSSTYVYNLKLGNENKQVCKEMFLSTLGIGKRQVHDWTNKIPRNEQNEFPNSTVSSTAEVIEEN